MKFRCTVKTAKGEPTFEVVLDAHNQTVAETRALEQARAAGATPQGRVKAIKVKD